MNNDIYLITKFKMLIMQLNDYWDYAWHLLNENFTYGNYMITVDKLDLIMRVLTSFPPWNNFVPEI